MAKQLEIRELLDPTELEQIMAFNENPLLVQAIKKTLLIPIQHFGTLPRGKKLPDLLLNWVIGLVVNDPKATDEEIGREVKVRQTATDMLDTAFKELEKIRRTVITPPAENEAR